MEQGASTHPPEVHTAFDHIEEEYRTLEGVTRWGRPIRIGAAVIITAGLIGAAVWWLMTPPPSSVVQSSYSVSTGTPIEVMEPKRMTLANPPDRFAWESVNGRLQYVVRVYVKGKSLPVLERRVTSPSFELSSDEQALLRDLAEAVRGGK
jgi:hypothetical protein